MADDEDDYGMYKLLEEDDEDEEVEEYDEDEDEDDGPAISFSQTARRSRESQDVQDMLDDDELLMGHLASMEGREDALVDDDGPKLRQETEKMMNDANRFYTQNESERAWDLCKEVIRHQPDVPDPYLTMALLVEDKGDIGRAAELNYMACQLKRSDMPLWQRTANMFFQVHENEKEAECYTHILRLDPVNQEALWDRHLAYRALNRLMEATQDLRKLYELRPRDLYIARALTDLYFRLGFWDATYHLLRDLLVPNEDYDLVDKFVQALIMLKRYDDARGAIQRYVRDVWATGVPTEIRATCGELAAAVDHWEEAEGFWKEFRKQGIESTPLLFFRMAKVYKFHGKYQEAAQIFEELSHLDEYSKDADVYFLRGECLMFIDMTENREAALDMMERVVELDPGHSDLRDRVEILIQYASNDRAKRLRHRLDEFELEQSRRAAQELRAQRGVFYGGEGTVEMEDEVEFNPDEFPPILPPHDTSLAIVTRAIGLYDNYHYKVVLEFVTPYLQKDVSRRAMKNSSSTSNSKKLTKKERRALFAQREELERLNPDSWRDVDRRAPRDPLDYEDDDDDSDEDVPRKRPRTEGEICIIEDVGTQRYWQFMWRVIRCLVRVQDYAAASGYISELLRMEWPTSGSTLMICQFAIALGWPFYEGDYHLAYGHIRKLLLKHPDDRFAWNAFCRITSGNFNLVRSLHKFLLRLTKKTNSPFLHLLMGHLYTSTNSLQHATQFYHKAFIAYSQKNQEEVLASFSLACSYLNLARNSRIVDDRHACVLRGIGLAFKASKMMDPSSFGYYNLGRCFHFLGILDCAVKFYELCLEKRKEETKLEVELDGSAKECRAIEREAAYNLSIIYRDSGNMSAALRTIREYISIK